MTKKSIFYFITTLTVLVLFILAGCAKTQESQNGGKTTVEEFQNGNLKEFDVIAKQWEFIPNVIEVNKGDKVRLKVTSIDVTHGIGIPDFGVDSVRLPPNETKVIEFIADKTGTFNTMICTVYCGAGHADMKGSIVIN